MEPESVCSFTDILLLGSLSLLGRWQQEKQFVPSLAALAVRHPVVRTVDFIVECSFGDSLSDLRYLNSPIDEQAVLTWSLVINLSRDM